MSANTLGIVIDPAVCTGCGLCVRVCPSDIISVHNNLARLTAADPCLYCGHCMAVCPPQAIYLPELDKDAGCFSFIDLDPAWLPPGTGPGKDLVRLIASRRSCRNFTGQPVEKHQLDDLIKLATWAPSGTNSQAWTFTCLGSRTQVLALGLSIKDFFKKLNKRAENRVLRKFLAFFGARALDRYFRNHYETVKIAIEQMETRNRDRLFHGAPALILVGSGPDASCPQEDALLAAGNILLGAHIMGLGSCLIGFAVAAMAADAAIQQNLGIPATEKIYAAIALGYPDETFQTITGRKIPLTRFI